MLFDSILVRDVTVERNNTAYKSFTLQVTEESSVRSFPQQFRQDFDTTQFNEVAVNDNWDDINIPVHRYNLSYNVDFAGILFTAKLKKFSARIKTRKNRKNPEDETFYTVYKLTFEKEIDPEVDGLISSMFKAKEVDENGKNKLKTCTTKLEKI